MIKNVKFRDSLFIGFNGKIGTAALESNIEIYVKGSANSIGYKLFELAN